MPYYSVFSLSVDVLIVEARRLLLLYHSELINFRDQ